MPYGKGYGAKRRNPHDDEDDTKGRYKAGRPAKTALMIVLGGRPPSEPDDDEDEYEEPDSLARIRKRLRKSRR